jgi:hypothetical protein
MQVFISWSGELSESIASAIHEWLPNVMQNVRPYFTAKDIDKGARWFNDISRELGQSKIGIICVTPDSLDSSWIMFEAGAISMAVSERKICPILFGMTKEQLRGPLSQFQAIEFEKNECYELIRTINGEFGEDALSERTLENAFEKWWPDFNKKIGALLKEYKPRKPREKTATEAHNEIVAMLRNIIEMRVSDMTRHIAEDIFVNIYANIDAAFANESMRLDRVESLLMLARNVEYLHQRLHKVPQHIERASRVIERLAAEKTKLEREASF